MQKTYKGLLSKIYERILKQLAQTVKCLPAMQETGFDSWVGKIPWRRKWKSTPALLPGKSHGHRRLIGYNPWGRKESDMTEQLVFIFIYKETTQFINGPKTLTDTSPKKIYRWQIST